MTESRKLVPLFCAALIALSGTALADGYEYEGKAMAPPEEGRKFTYSFGLAGTSDYVFRGISQTDNDPTIQGSIDIGYGIFYAGVWGSGLGDGFGANAEYDWYGGIKPSWDTHTFLGKLEFDFGVIYYTYPGASDAAGEFNYVELKAGYSSSFWSFLIPGLTSGTTVYYTPDNFGETGPVWTIESNYAWEGHEIRGITPTLSGTFGSVYGDLSEGYNLNGFGEDHYYYWNAGLALGVGGITFDFRYWDTDIGNVNPITGGFCGKTADCDERFVATVSVSVP